VAGSDGGLEYLVNVMWPLTAFTKRNGGTRVWIGIQFDQDISLLPEEESIVPTVAPGDALIFLGSPQSRPVEIGAPDPRVVPVSLLRFRAASYSASSFSVGTCFSRRTPSLIENLPRRQLGR